MTRFLVLILPVLLLAGCGSSGKSKTTSSSSSSSASTGSSGGGGSDLTETASDFKFSQTNFTAKAGKVKITLTNNGQATHEFVVLKTDAAPDSLKVSGGKVSEKDSVGEISETDAGKSATHTFNLKPGKYVFVCNVPGHYGDGMRGQLTVN